MEVKFQNHIKHIDKSLICQLDTSKVKKRKLATEVSIKKSKKEKVSTSVNQPNDNQSNREVISNMTVDLSSEDDEVTVIINLPENLPEKEILTK